jgi:hypothetical protein
VDNLSFDQLQPLTSVQIKNLQMAWNKIRIDPRKQMRLGLKARGDYIG